MVLSPKLVLSKNTDMKVLKSSSISSFGGLNFVLEELDKLGIGQLLQRDLPKLPEQSKYTWKDLLYSFWSIFFCGGDCIEDLSIHLKDAFNGHPNIKVPSPDRVLERMRELSCPLQIFDTSRGNKLHEFSFNEHLNNLNIKLLKRFASIHKQKNILDYDNTILFTEKADAAMTYKKRTGYCPGVGIIGNNIVYIENRNGNSGAQILQQDTLTRLFDLLATQGITIDAFRADSASYQLSTLTVISCNVNKLYIRARMSESIHEAICRIEHWKESTNGDQIVYRGEVEFTPFEKIAKRTRQHHLLKPYRLIVTKEKRNDGQANLFTGEAFNYSTIITNDHEMTANQVVCFYNQRGAIEREFDILKNDFGWYNMPFSEMQYNNVFLILTAIFKKCHEFL